MYPPLQKLVIMHFGDRLTTSKTQAQPLPAHQLVVSPAHPHTGLWARSIDQAETKIQVFGHCMPAMKQIL